MTRKNFGCKDETPAPATKVGGTGVERDWNYKYEKCTPHDRSMSDQNIVAKSSKHGNARDTRQSIRLQQTEINECAPRHAVDETMSKVSDPKIHERIQGNRAGQSMTPATHF